MSVRVLTFGAAALAVAFASMAAELTLAQSMAVIYGDTITSYSLVIGFFVLSLGLGAAYWARVERRPTALDLWRIEIALAVLGAVAPFAIFRSEFGGASGMPWGMILALGFALLIGLLSGMEIPLLIALAGDRGNGFQATRAIIGLDFMGTFVASVVVPLWLFVEIGLVGVPLVSGLVNVFLGILILLVGRVLTPVRVLSTLLLGVGILWLLGCVVEIEAYLAQGVF